MFRLVAYPAGLLSSGTKSCHGYGRKWPGGQRSPPSPQYLLLRQVRVRVRVPRHRCHFCDVRSTRLRIIASEMLEDSSGSNKSGNKSGSSSGNSSGNSSNNSNSGNSSGGSSGGRNMSGRSVRSGGSSGSNKRIRAAATSAAATRATAAATAAAATAASTKDQMLSY
mmetsp:Transcript_34968/g.70727  ORF Transcript_34968/g.70727 Transcript_34968/m.70727 type:complete len:167 (-) Transcript_34968:607-1107(-)